MCQSLEVPRIMGQDLALMFKGLGRAAIQRQEAELTFDADVGLQAKTWTRAVLTSVKLSQFSAVGMSQAPLIPPCAGLLLRVCW
mmetsp:Transcript_6670/g.11681  ORF Transcript_6670/g.11681 Transcript_6670/m.11681 type:complete len:84 (+) Transcript_6670:1382-1633(+)